MFVDESLSCNNFDRFYYKMLSSDIHLLYVSVRVAQCELAGCDYSKRRMQADMCGLCIMDEKFRWGHSSQTPPNS